jgi:hypothetical protein
MRPVLAVAFLALVVSAGCVAPGGGSQTNTTLTDATSETTSAESTTGTDATTETPSATTTTVEYEKGDELLSASELNESQAMQFDASERADFGNLSETRRQVVKRTIECDCNVELDGEFDYHDEERIEVVKYDGTYYYLRITIV